MNKPSNHLPHLLLFAHAVERRRSGRSEVTIPPELFLVRTEENAFWEMIGVAVRGLPSLMLGALRFRRQSKQADDLSRESLVSYLAAPVREIGIDHQPRPPGLIEMAVPDTSVPVIQWLKSCREGRELPLTLIDRREILFAFDFRLDNPSRSQRRQPAPQEGRFVFRTTAGHVLSAQPHRLPTKLHREDPFLALTRPTQHTATVDRPLPTLVVHRSFLSITAPLGDQPTEWLHRSQVFHTQTANPEHLLDPELETYRLYRHRESQETPRHLTRPEALAG